MDRKVRVNHAQVMTDMDYQEKIGITIGFEIAFEDRIHFEKGCNDHCF